MVRKPPKGRSLPINKVASEPMGPEPQLHQASPQPTFHFTRLHQLDRLIDSSEADPDMGFMARLLALCSLPRTNPRNRLQYVRRNGPYTLTITATGPHKLPFGNLPRLLLAWVCTEAVRTRSRELVLGRSLSQFMRKLFIYHDSGGATGVQTRLRNQMQSLFQSTIRLTYDDAHGEVSISSPVTDRTEFWWNKRQPDAPMLWNSKIELGEKFFNEIIRHSMPLNMNVLRALSRSSLGLDLYLWLLYRTFTLKHPLKLSWVQLYLQFGADPARGGDKRTVDAFRTDCLRELKKIKLAWPNLDYAIPRGALEIRTCLMAASEDRRSL